MIRAMQISDVPRIAEIHVFGWRSAYEKYIDFLSVKEIRYIKALHSHGNGME